jgi:hypothetical protein
MEKQYPFPSFLVFDNGINLPRNM